MSAIRLVFDVEVRRWASLSFYKPCSVVLPIGTSLTIGELHGEVKEYWYRTEDDRLDIHVHDADAKEGREGFWADDMGDFLWILGSLLGEGWVLDHPGNLKANMEAKAKEGTLAREH